MDDSQAIGRGRCAELGSVGAQGACRQPDAQCGIETGSEQPAIGVAVLGLELTLALALLLAPARNGIAGLLFLRLVLPRFGRACLS